MSDQTIVQEPEEQKPVETREEIRARTRAQVAKEMFGKEYYGEVEETKPVEQPKPDDTKEGEEAPVEEPTEGEEIEAPEEGEIAPEEGKDETPIDRLSELVQHYEPDIDLEYVNTLKVPVTVDGTQTEATIGDLVKSYQLGQAAEHRLELAKDYQAKQGEAWAAKQAELDRQIVQLGALLQHEDEKLAADMQAVDPRLRVEDPAEWSAKQTEFGQRQARLAAIKADALAKYNASVETRNAEQKRIIDAYRDSQRPVLLQLIPEWRDEERSAPERAETAFYLTNTYGYQPKEIEDAVDARYFAIARKAMLYDKSRGQVDTARKRVAKVPKVMKPSPPKAQEQLATERLAALRAKMQKTASQDDATRYLMAKRGLLK